jgi:hypothetical protein
MQATKHEKIVFGVWPAAHFEAQMTFYVVKTDVLCFRIAIDTSKYQSIYQISVDTALTRYQVTWYLWNCRIVSTWYIMLIQYQLIYQYQLWHKPSVRHVVRTEHDSNPKADKRIQSTRELLLVENGLLVPEPIKALLIARKGDLTECTLTLYAWLSGPVQMRLAQSMMRWLALVIYSWRACTQW